MTVPKITITGPIHDPTGAVRANEPFVIRLETGGAGHGFSTEGPVVGTYKGRTDSDGMIYDRNGSPIKLVRNDQITNVPITATTGSYWSCTIVGRTPFAWNAQFGAAVADGTAVLWGDPTYTVDTPTVPVAQGTTGAPGPQGPAGVASATAPVVLTGTVVSMPAATDSTPGHLTAVDHAKITNAAADSAVVHNTGTENVNGAKTFGSPISAAAPTAAGHVPVVQAPVTQTAGPSTVRVPSGQTYPELHRNADPLKNWWSRLSGMKDRRATVLFIGDSRFEGIGCSNRENRVPSQFRDAIRGYKNGGGRLDLTTWGSYAMGLNNLLGAAEQGTTYRGQGTVTWPTFWTKTGAGTAAQTAGYGWGLVSTLLTGVVTMTASWTGDYVDVPYTKLPTGTGFDVSIDGGAATHYDGYAASQTEAVLTLGPFTDRTSHTIAISPSTTATSHPATIPTANIMIGHPIFYSGNYASGISVLNGGCGGAQTSDWATNAVSVGAAVAQASPDLIVVDLGINDYNNGQTTNQFSTSLTTLVTQLQTSAPNASIALMHPVVGSVGAGTRAGLQPFWNVIDAVGAAKGCAVLQIGEAIPDMVSPDTARNSYDFLHYADQGARLVAAELVRELLPQRAKDMNLLDHPDVTSVGVTTGAFPYVGAGPVISWVAPPTGGALGQVISPTVVGPFWQSIGTRTVYFLVGSTGVASAAAPGAGVAELVLTGLGGTSLRQTAQMSFGTLVRLSCNVGNVGSAGTTLTVQYATNHASPSFASLGAGASVAIDVSGLREATFTAPAGAGLFGGPGDVILRLVTAGGNGVTVPSFSWIKLEIA